MFGLSVDALRRIKKVFSKFSKIQKVILYGSRAKGNYKKGSDIDITLIGKGLTLDNSIYPLMEELDELYLPYKFDISIFNQLEDTDLIDHILRVGIIFYQKSFCFIHEWRNLTLDEVIELKYGKPLPVEYRVDDGIFPAYGANGIKCHTNNAYCKKPSIIVGRKGSAGELNLVDGAFWPLDVTYFIIFDEREYNLRFLYYLLSQLDLPSLAKGVKPGLNRNDVYKIRQYFPTLPEQKRIVAILDEAFTAIATATANTEKNLANARELFDSELARVFQISNYVDSLGATAGEGWEQATLGTVCEVIAGQSPKGRNYNDSGDGLPFYQGKKEFRSKCLGAPTKWTTQVTQEAVVGDILMSVRAPVGPINFAVERICIGRGLASIRAGEQIDREFLFYLLLSMQNQIKGSEGAVFSSINKKQIESIRFSKPSLSRQKKIASFLGKLSAKQQTLIGIYETKIKALSELKQSLLHMAFTGELTADSKSANLKLSEAGI